MKGNNLGIYAVCVLLSSFIAPLAQAEDAYVGHIDGEYEGWDGDTIYKLQDGHIIQQSSYHYRYHYAYSPKVIIYRDGSRYKIHVEGDNGEDIEVEFLK